MTKPKLAAMARTLYRVVSRWQKQYGFSDDHSALSDPQLYREKITLGDLKALAKHAQPKRGKK